MAFSQNADAVVSPKDPLRVEIERALECGIPITPILIGDASMPHPENLPESLQPLTEFNAIRIKDPSFHEDLSRLCGNLRDYDPAAFARKLPPAYWDDVVLPSDTTEQVRLILAGFRTRETLQHWGSSNEAGEGTTVLLSGPAGCGKTLLTRALAYETGFDVYRIDLEDVLLRWNVGGRLPINWLFQRKTANPIVVQVRETAGADELPPSGSMNAAVATSLIRQLGQRDGMTVFTTRRTSESGFLRDHRFDHVVQLPFPEEESRRLIWQREFPVRMPVDTIDIDALALHRMSGRGIHRAVRRAAVQAAWESSQVTMDHVLSAVRREMENAS